MDLAFDSTAFWVIAAAMTAVALAFVVPYLIAQRSASSPARRARLVAGIYRSNLAELEREHHAGRLTDGEYAQAREETERRLLADADDAADPAPAAAPRGVLIALVVALPVLAFGLYALFGEPGALERTSTAELTANDPASGAPIRRDDLVRHLAHNARDGRGWVLLARIDFVADRFSGAAESYGKALAASPKIAADAGIWCEYADALGMAQGGVLAGLPREHVMRALALDPAHPKALEMAGSAAFEQREFASAARYWRTLLAQIPERSVEHRELSAAIVRADAFALTAADSGNRAR
jgi:cytochrome c-type biogenesis protein CcmH